MPSRAKSDHGGYGGRTLISRIEAQMDKRRKVMETLRCHPDPEEYKFQTGRNTSQDLELTKGRYEGLAAALAILRSSNVPDEISRSNERLGIE